MAGKIACDVAIPGMFPGRKIEIEGSTSHSTSRFDINLENRDGGSYRVNIPLHISFRFLEGCVVRNTQNERGWGAEEKFGGMPLIRGKPFKVVLECKSSAISISFGLMHFCDFAHRLPFHTISHITVERDVTIKGVRFEESSSLPQQWPSPSTENIREMIVPQTLTDRKIKVLGNIPAYSDRFDINLKCKSSNEIALHVSVRFNEQCIVRNTFTGNTWGQEEKTGGMPLSRGMPLSMELLCKAHAITVSFNGIHFCEFSHRIPFHKISHVTVDRDVIVTSIKFMPQSSKFPYRLR